MEYIVSWFEYTEYGGKQRSPLKKEPKELVDRLLSENVDIVIYPHSGERIYNYPSLVFNCFNKKWYLYTERYHSTETTYEQGMERMKKRMDMGLGILLKY